MFPIYVYDGDATLPEDSICYLVTKNGLFLKKKIGLMDSVTPVQTIGFLQPLTTSVKMDVKIPFDIIQKTYSFMKAIYEDLRSESMVIVTKDQKTGKYGLIVPQQVVTGGSIRYETDKTFNDPNKLKIGTIHSHASMSAFHSSVDVADEKDWDGIHITLGNLNMENQCSIACTIAANGQRCVSEPMDYIDGLEMEKLAELDIEPTNVFGIQESVAVIDRVFNPLNPLYAQPKKSPFYLINYKDSFPESWLKLVAKPEYKVSQCQPGNSHVVQGFMGVNPNLLGFDSDLRGMFRERDYEEKCSTCIYKQMYEDEVNEGMEEGDITVLSENDITEMVATAFGTEGGTSDFNERMADMLKKGEI